MGYFAPRIVETGLKCPQCGEKLHAERSCKHVQLRCHKCNKICNLKDYINSGDEKLEAFLENIYIDRI